MNTTQKVTVLLSVAAAMALANHGLAAEAFIRPTIFYVEPATDGFKSATGYGVAGGVCFGSGENHEVSIEWDYVKWDFHLTVSPGVDLASWYEKFMPVMVNYRYYVAGTEELKNVRFYIGPSAGMTRSEFGGTLSGVGSTSDSKWTFSWGGSVGFVVKLAKRVDLDIGYRYIKIQGGTYHFEGLPVRFEDSHANVFYGGIGIRF
jgi:opacity protein-like surface antigen